MKKLSFRGNPQWKLTDRQLAFGGILYDSPMAPAQTASHGDDLNNSPMYVFFPPTSSFYTTTAILWNNIMNSFHARPCFKVCIQRNTTQGIINSNPSKQIQEEYLQITYLKIVVCALLS